MRGKVECPRQLTQALAGDLMVAGAPSLALCGPPSVPGTVREAYLPGPPEPELSDDEAFADEFGCLPVEI